ncbi:MAG: PHP domain-containing protein [Spirochaetes bacterium]|nr:PHP domain-containing protein [Spirochaetota bacterium]
MFIGNLIKKNIKNYFNSSVDLHLHSNLSDGTYSVKEIYFNAKKLKMKIISINDHDNIIPENEYNEFLKDSSLKLINGIETSSFLYYKEKKFSVHVLGYKVKDYNKVLKLVEELKKFRRERNLKILNKMKDFFYKNNILFDFESFERNSDFNKISRLHYAKILFDLKIEKSVKKAFKKYLTRDGVLYCEKKNFDFLELINYLKDCFAKVFLAHPFISFPKELISNKKQLMKYFDNIILNGIDGIEVFYPEFKSNEEKILYNYCLKNNIPISCGSDFHGLNKPYIKIGEISKNLTTEIEERIINYFINI